MIPFNYYELRSKVLVGLPMPSAEAELLRILACLIELHRRFWTSVKVGNE